jgi:hypothetical protein
MKTVCKILDYPIPSYAKLDDVADALLYAIVCMNDVDPASTANLDQRKGVVHIDLEKQDELDLSLNTLLITEPEPSPPTAPTSASAPSASAP